MTHAHAHAPDHDADPSIHKGQETIGFLSFTKDKTRVSTPTDNPVPAPAFL